MALASSGGVVNLSAGRGDIGLIGEQCNVPSLVADGACMSLCWSVCSKSR